MTPAAADGPMWILSGADGDSPFRFRLRSGAIRTLGRATRADFILDAPLVSRLHCRLTAHDDRVEIEDLASTNGTFVNDARVRKTDARAGDRLRVGRVEFTLEKD
jgi:pSer/pThr/pTyr-binding forkhead associated (FHA) protein